MALGASQAARFQAYGTRARISIVVWFRIILCIIFVWAALTVGVVWYETGTAFPQLGHQYFWHWVICGTITNAPLLSFYAAHLRVPLAGQWYPLPQLLDWLDGPQLYHLPFSAWFLHYGSQDGSLPDLARDAYADLASPPPSRGGAPARAAAAHAATAQPSNQRRMVHSKLPEADGGSPRHKARLSNPAPRA
jgi:hypothetical protein